MGDLKGCVSCCADSGLDFGDSSFAVFFLWVRDFMIPFFNAIRFECKRMEDCLCYLYSLDYLN